MKREENRFEPHGGFRLIKFFAPKQHESVTENLGLRGFWDLAKYIWAEQRFDRRFGVETEVFVDPDALGFADQAAQNAASGYRATPPD